MAKSQSKTHYRAIFGVAHEFAPYVPCAFMACNRIIELTIKSVTGSAQKSLSVFHSLCSLYIFIGFGLPLALVQLIRSKADAQILSERESKCQMALSARMHDSRSLNVFVVFYIKK